jgi:hypothetical protein
MSIMRAKGRSCPVPTIDVTAPPGLNRLMGRSQLAATDVVDRKEVAVNLAESPLAWLVRRGLLEPHQFAAGERLRADFMRAGHSPSITMRWGGAPIGSGARGAPAVADPTTARIAARQRFDAAVTAAGPGLSDVLWRVVCMGEGLETAERALQWPARAAKLVLCLALDRIAGFYGLATPRLSPAAA